MARGGEVLLRSPRSRQLSRSSLPSQEILESGVRAQAEGWRAALHNGWSPSSSFLGLIDLALCADGGFLDAAVNKDQTNGP